MLCFPFQNHLQIGKPINASESSNKVRMMSINDSIICLDLLLSGKVNCSVWQFGENCIEDIKREVKVMTDSSRDKGKDLLE